MEEQFRYRNKSNCDLIKPDNESSSLLQITMNDRIQEHNTESPEHTCDVANRQ